MRVARGILMDSDKTGHAAALLILATHRVTGALGRDHQHVDGLLGLDEIEMDVEAMGEGDRRIVANMGGDLSRQISAWSSSGVAIIMRSAHLAASAQS